MDRPSFMFHGGRQGCIGLLGSASPMRSYEKSFRDNGMPVYVHAAPGGIPEPELQQNVEADLSDLNFMLRFQEGLTTSPHFRDLHIAPGNYGNGETHETVFQKLSAIDLEQSPSVLDTFNDRSIQPFNYSNPKGLLRTLATEAAFCSIKMSFAMAVGASKGFTPLADAVPYGNLLSAKYAREIAVSHPSDRKILATDLSLAIFDELIAPEVLEKLEVPDVIKLRKESESARNVFLEELLILQAKIGGTQPGEG